MIVRIFESEFEVPDVLIDKYIRDFDGLPGSGNHESIMQLRNTVTETLDIVAEEPDIIQEPEYLLDFIKAIAIRQALKTHGLLYDA